ncbi:MAG: uridine kinase [Puniceicoccaceae bacterium 5H]|nr:MAG: uridine kinase [Puniceicoccaceae bacterium 5H]
MSVPFFIGVCGGSASGKSTLAQRLTTAIGEPHACLLELDCYYRNRENIPPEHRGNYDHPASLDTALFVHHLHELRAGNPVEVPCYDYRLHRREPGNPLAPHPVVVVDGCLLLALPEVRACLDVTIFVDAPADLRLARRLQRDVAERGRTLESVLEQYLTTVRPMHAQFVQPYLEQADVLIDNQRGLDIAFATLLEGLRQLAHPKLSPWLP